MTFGNGISPPDHHPPRGGSQALAKAAETPRKTTRRRSASTIDDTPEAALGGAEVRSWHESSDVVGVALLDARGVIVSVNAAWRETIAAQPCEAQAFGVGMAYEQACRRIIPDLDPDLLGEAMRQLLAREIHELTRRYVTQTTSGPRWRQIRVAPLRSGAARFIAVHDEVSVARDQAAAAATAGQLLSARQEERERIAIELHDSTGQRLAALSTGISHLRRLMGARAQALGILDDMADSLQEAAREINAMSYLMRPPSLREGLETTARRYVKAFGIRTGLATLFRSEGPVDRVTPLIQHAAFRVIQEALSNVHRHAEADGVEVELASRDAQLMLRIADDGHGIAPLRPHLEGIPPGVGITGMRSRVEQLYGALEIATDAAGTVVTARIPLASPMGPRRASFGRSARSA